MRGATLRPGHVSSTSCWPASRRSPDPMPRRSSRAALSTTPTPVRSGAAGGSGPAWRRRCRAAPARAPADRFASAGDRPQRWPPGSLQLSSRDGDRCEPTSSRATAPVRFRHLARARARIRDRSRRPVRMAARPRSQGEPRHADPAHRGAAVRDLGDTSEAYFADGVSDAVRSKLTTLPGLVADRPDQLDPVPRRLEGASRHRERARRALPPHRRGPVGQGERRHEPSAGEPRADRDRPTAAPQRAAAQPFDAVLTD